MIPLLLFLLGCVAVYVSTVQAAFSVLMRLSLRLIAEHNGRHEPRLARYLEDPVALFVPARVLLGVVFAAATVLLAMLVGVSGLRTGGVLLVSVAAFVLVTEHLVPLLIVRRDPERVLEVLLPSFHVLVGLFRPVTQPLLGMIAAAGRERHEVPPSEAESRVEESSETGAASAQAEGERAVIGSEERRLLRSVVEFGNTLVREVMTPRPDIVAIRADATVHELRSLFAEQEYSRVPAYRENLDNILGFVFVKDLIHLTDAAGDERPIPRLLRPAHVIPETKRVAELLKEFQRHQIQIAIVVDEYGGTAGLVTIEDLLEEIVGEIRDEYDVETEPVVDEGQGSFVFSGKVNIDEVADRLGVEIERGGFETVGGYVLSQVGRVPAVGEMFDLTGLTIEVLEAERRRVNRVRIRRREPVSSDAVQ